MNLFNVLSGKVISMPNVIGTRIPTFTRIILVQFLTNILHKSQFKKKTNI